MSLAANASLRTTHLREKKGFTGMVVVDHLAIALLQTFYGVVTDFGDTDGQALFVGID
jgi:beta-glucosidase-like glycosyl hydrolase